MDRIRAYYDADRIDKFSIPTVYQTDQNKYEIFCSLCGQNVFVNELIFKDVGRIIDTTRENPFLCEECIREYEDSAYQ